MGASEVATVSASTCRVPLVRSCVEAVRGAPVIEAFDGETVAVSAFATGETPFLISMRDARCVQLEPCRIDVVIKSFD
jgi:hypothetical protein